MYEQSLGTMSPSIGRGPAWEGETRMWRYSKNKGGLPIYNPNRDLDFEQLLIFNTLPVDLTFVDERQGDSLPDQGSDLPGPLPS